MDKALLEELYQRYGAEIFRYLYAMCRDRLLAEDVMQDAFCRALISLPSSHVNARAWLYMVGRNLLINEMKKRKRELCLDDMESRDVQRRKSGEGIADGDPEEQAIRKEENSMLQEALLSLDERKREILILNYFERFTLKEAAVIMGISYENARILSMRAKRELRRIMEVNGYEIS
ncbi:MAG: RNA polymerase sigma factor [Mediterraneibacter sp.]